MTDNYDPLSHVPDPSDRFQVFAYTRGVEIFVEIREKGSNVGLTVPWLEALSVASRINRQVTYAVEGFLTQVKDGTIPEFERRIESGGRTARERRSRTEQRATMHEAPLMSMTRQRHP